MRLLSWLCGLRSPFWPDLSLAVFVHGRVCKIVFFSPLNLKEFRNRIVFNIWTIFHFYFRKLPILWAWMAFEVEILESSVNEPDSACSVWSNLASACLCNDTEISLFSFFNSCVANMWRLRTKRSHQRPGRGEINEASVYFVSLCSQNLWQNDTKLANIQGEFNGLSELLAETQLLSAPSPVHPVVMEVPLPPMSVGSSITLWGRMKMTAVWADMLLRVLLPAPTPPSHRCSQH